ncbi:hypothetical protein BCR41DRAFT_349030 [Lobosporangium transversale]|uniref:RNI-like protein n=1 Tax=Lobosporangium transversale TaxID=64571 RepID=A0A1Y2GU21_9FUNG|nr:hypothetical protein BCR41DRAFT_349030 [Lobosporangium transversale]ORZ23721.1 hypothetical protein BCR41DRAFT_349030 [Lobosporangium transversale]|eukprot:XP_021883535.1 hypothetical protein BCR41DRAFT_349030 [Lobosporangium transversale]
MTEPQYQQFRKNGIIEEVCVRTASTNASIGNPLCYVSLEDIRDVFPDALRFKLNGHPIPFLLDANDNRIEPLRIAFYPDKILDVITDAPQSSNSNKSLTVHNNKDFSSHSDEIKEWMVKVEDKGDMMLTLEDKMGKAFELQVEMYKMQLELKDEVVKLQSEVKEMNAKVHKLQLEVKEENDKVLEMEKENHSLLQQALNRLAILQQKAEAILVQTFELHEYPIPRLFIILPEDRTEWDPMNILRKKFRLHFLCECGDHTVETGKSSQNQTHFAKHEGYIVRNSTEFFQKYGKYMAILLQCLSVGVPLAAPLGPVPDLKAGIDYSLDYMKALSAEFPALNSINTIEDYATLEGADLRGLSKFLQINDEDGKLGNLYRIRTEAGHVKWVCIGHFSSTYKEEEQKAFEDVVEMNGGEYDSQLGKVVIELGSKITARGFFGAMAKAKRVYELDITFKSGWDWTKTDLETLENALRVSSVSVLRLDLGSPQEGITRKLRLTTIYEKLVRIIEVNTMKVVRIVLSPDLTKLSSLPNQKLRHHHELTFEMRLRDIRRDDFQELVNSLATNMTLASLDLKHNSIRNEGAFALSEALKTNMKLTTIDLRHNLIGDEGALALSKALKANTTLAVLDLRANPITKEGVLELLGALKTSPTLATLGLRHSIVTEELSEALKGNATSATLNSSHSSIRDEIVLALVEALKTNMILTNLNLGHNSIEREGALALSRALKTNMTLTNLSLKGSSIGKEGALALSEALRTNTSLTNLDLHGNSIGDKGAQGLSEALETNMTLANLDLENNSIRKEGALALSEALKTNTSLTDLDLSWNSIGKEGALALSEALKTNTSLANVNLTSNSIGKEGALALSEALKTNMTLTNLNLRYNSIGKEGALALSEALKTNTSLTNLDLGNNSIGNEGALVLSEALKINTSLTNLDLWANSIGDKGALALSGALKVNTSLTNLDLRGNLIRNERALTLSEALKTNMVLNYLDLGSNPIMRR